MAKPDFSNIDKQIRGAVKNVRKVLDPEYEIPADAEKNPLNYRILRLTALVDEAKTRHKELGQDLDKINTNLRSLLELLNENGEGAQQKSKKKQGEKKK